MCDAQRTPRHVMSVLEPKSCGIKGSDAQPRDCETWSQSAQAEDNYKHRMRDAEFINVKRVWRQRSCVWKYYSLLSTHCCIKDTHHAHMVSANLTVDDRSQYPPACVPQTKFTARRSKNKILDGWHPFSGDTRGILPCVYLMDPNHWITETLSALSQRSLPCICCCCAVQQIGPFSVGKIIDSLVRSRCAAAHFRKTSHTK